MGFMRRFLNTKRELRAVTLARVIDLRGRLELKMESGEGNSLLTTAEHQLAMCGMALETIHSRASSVAVAQIHFDAAFILYLRATGIDETISMMPAILSTVRENLASGDLRRKAVEVIANEVSEASQEAPAVTRLDREMVLDTLAAANQARIDKSLRIRSFVRIVTFVGILLTFVAVCVAALGAMRPEAVPLCFIPREQEGGYFTVCPLAMGWGGMPASPDPGATDPADYLVVEIVGLVSAGLAAATAIRHMRGNTTPYNVSLVLAALKLPTGALTAPLGLLFIRGGFVPGLSALDSSAQIIAWAIVFGYSQQIFTRLVDNQAKSILGEPQDTSKAAGEFADHV
jgi:hypothetical protein